MLIRTALSMVVLMSVFAGCVMHSEWGVQDMPPTRTYGPDKDGVVCYESVRRRQRYMSCLPQGAEKPRRALAKPQA